MTPEQLCKAVEADMREIYNDKHLTVNISYLTYNGWFLTTNGFVWNTLISETLDELHNKVRKMRDDKRKQQEASRQ